MSDCPGERDRSGAGEGGEKPEGKECFSESESSMRRSSAESGAMLT
jgi:hypothetical protein